MPSATSSGPAIVPRSGLTRDVVIERGAELLESRPDDLTIAALAEVLGVRAPSLYKHVDGLPGLRRGIVLRAKAGLAAALAKATIGRSGDDAVRALAEAWRDWARQHPVQYSMTVAAARPGDDEDAAVSGELIEIVYSSLSGYGLAGDELIDAVRFLRSAVHGFLSLEAAGAFALPTALDHSYAMLVESAIGALSGWGARGRS